MFLPFATINDHFLDDVLKLQPQGTGCSSHQFNYIYSNENRMDFFANSCARVNLPEPGSPERM
jgi:hypothetical protein